MFPENFENYKSTAFWENNYKSFSKEGRKGGRGQKEGREEGTQEVKPSWQSSDQLIETTGLINQELMKTGHQEAELGLK